MAHWKHKSCSIPQLNVSMLRIDPDPSRESYVHYDGPAGYGPRRVRQQARGPYWHGEVTPRFAASLVKRALKHGYRVVCDGNPL